MMVYYLRSTFHQNLEAIAFQLEGLILTYVFSLLHFFRNCLQIVQAHKHRQRETHFLDSKVLSDAIARSFKEHLNVSVKVVSNTDIYTCTQR